FGAGWTDEDTSCIAELRADALDRLAHRWSEALRRHADVLLALREALQDARGLAERPAAERPAEEEGRREAVAGDVVLEVDDVAGLLSAEDAALTLERLEDVAVADVRGEHADAVLPHQRMEAQVRHLGDDHQVDILRKREHREDAVSVDH